ncbi:MAG: transketolase family protein [Erysipelothrix sp.]|jgi:transketolase|nr:transketolase family protein [Erysipelothrix sp.]
MSKVATRVAYGEALAALVADDERIFVLDADLSGSTHTNRAQKVKPERHFNSGIAEANMMGMAAGIASGGNIVFASTFAMFAAGRAFEQVRNSIAYTNLNVKICATHAGITLGEDGASHQAIEDIALMRAVPNMHVIQPADDVETKAVIKAIVDLEGPFYVRLGRSAVGRVNSDGYVFELGKGHVISQGKDIAIIATGVMVEQAMLAKEALLKEGIDVTVVNMASIKPIDKDLIIELSKTHKALISAEEHNVIGGLGSAVAEVLSQNNPTRLKIVGVEDTFGESGKPDELLDKYGLSYDHLVDHVKALLKELD